MWEPDSKFTSEHNSKKPLHISRPLAMETGRYPPCIGMERRRLRSEIGHSQILCSAFFHGNNLREARAPNRTHQVPRLREAGLVLRQDVPELRLLGAGRAICS